ncbi:MAG: hypothetical protein L0219_15205 [Phycisphaerales bacterium]|nr:hypothetical protein [Phycisphaerales bacterium]
MRNTLHQFMRATLIAVGALTTAALAQTINAQVAPPAAEPEGFIAVIKGQDVYVRCGAAESYYPFSKVDTGDLVKVTGEKFDWVRVVTVGPAFKHGFGYVKQSKDEAGRFRLTADGTSGVTLGKTEIIAPNLDAKNEPKDSWKSIVRLEADQTLRVLGTIQTDKDIIYKVALPASAQGWISKAYIERGTPDQEAQWKIMLTKVAKGVDEEAPPPSAADEPPVHSVSNAPVNKTPAQANPECDETEADDSGLPPAVVAVADTPVQPAEPKKATFEDLEAAYKLLQKEPIHTAEVGPLRALYIDLAERSSADQRTARRAKARSQQLEIWADIQKRRTDLEAFRARSKMSAEETDAVRKALESSAEYAAVGRIAASTIYDGKSLPRLLRIQDAASGRTIAYLQPDEQMELVNLIGTLVGVVGERNYDETLRLNIITPGRIDSLTPDGAQAPVPVLATDQKPQAPKVDSK